MRIRATVVAGPLLTLELDLGDPMIVDSVKVAGTAVPFTHALDLLTVTLDRAWLTGESLDLTVWYHGTPGAGAFGAAFAFTTKQHAAHGLDAERAVRRAHLVALQGLPGGQGRLGEHARHGADRPDHRRATACCVASSDNGTHGRHLLARAPPDHHLPGLAGQPPLHRSTPTGTCPPRGDSMAIDVLQLPRQTASRARPVQAKVKDMIAAFAARFGEYPFLDEKYGHAEFPWGGGMEHQTCTSLGAYLRVRSWPTSWRTSGGATW